jgi:hypothetical protein
MATNAKIASPARATFTHSEELNRVLLAISWKASDCVPATWRGRFDWSSVSVSTVASGADVGVMVMW